jgi:serine/threonine protein kinase
VVYEARDKLSLAHVAIKRGKESVAVEAKLLQELGRCSNVVSYINDFESAAHHYLVMELCGASLQTISPLSEHTCARLLRGICAALAALHMKGIVHMDVKPANILLSLKGDSAVLADFGLSMRLRSEVVTGPGGGSAPFMAPEALTDAIPTFAADIYSFGATLYTLVAGRTLFHGMTQQAALMSLARDDDPAALSSARQTPRIHISASLKDLLNRCLVRDIRLRPSMVELQEHKFWTLCAADDDNITVPSGTRLDLNNICPELPSPLFSPTAQPQESRDRPEEPRRAAADCRFVALDIADTAEGAADLSAAVAGRSLGELAARLASLQLGRIAEIDFDIDEGDA